MYNVKKKIKINIKKGILGEIYILLGIETNFN